MSKIYHAYKVEWVDSCAWPGWQNFRTLRGECSRITSIGFLIEKTTERVGISASLSTTGAADSPIYIPRVAVTKMTRLPHSITLKDE